MRGWQTNRGGSPRPAPRHGQARPDFARRALAALALATLGALCCCRGAPEVAIHTAAGKVLRVPVALALTEPERARGLMYRPALESGHGMLFVFPREEVHTFWMKNTLFPLDLLFIASDGRVVAIFPEAQPLSEDPMGTSTPSRYVLEVPAGFCTRNGVSVGDRVELPRLAPSEG